MSRKNRAFALAVATAALVGLSAPVAGAATLQGPSGFNNDSILNLSGNQIPIAACNLGIPVDALLAQIPITGLGVVSGMLNSTTMSPTNTQTCTQAPTETNTSTTNTDSGNASTPTTPSETDVSTPADDGTSGFNGDSVLNVSGNQVPVAICNVAAPITATGLQVPISLVSGVLDSGALNSTTLNPSNTQDCTQTPGEANTSTTDTNSNNGNNG